MKYNSKYEEMVYILLPKIRKYLAKKLKKKMNQKEIAKVMSLTEGAISQYLSNKRVTKGRLNVAQKNYLDNIQITKQSKINYDDCIEMCWTLRNSNGKRNI